MVQSLQPSRVWMRSTDCGSGWSTREGLYLCSLLLGVQLFSIKCWVGVNAQLCELERWSITDVDGMRQSWEICKLSEITGPAGERKRRELIPQSLLVLLYRFFGSAIGTARRGPIGSGRESSIPISSGSLNFSICCFMNYS